MLFKLACPDPPQIWRIGSMEAVVAANGGVAYTDGSGGPKAPAHCSVVGCGAAAFSQTPGPQASDPEASGNIEEKIAAFKIQRLALRFSGVPGRQTVPRSETHAVSLASREAGQARLARVCIDALYTVIGARAFFDGEAGERAKWLTGTSGDLWQEHAELENAGFAGEKVRGHASFKDVFEEKVGVEDFIGNVLADACADAAADALAVPLEDRKGAFSDVRLATLISLRLAVIEDLLRSQREIMI